jgi:hypothetical protein
MTRIDCSRNKYIRGSLKVVPVTEMNSNRLVLYGHVMRKDGGQMANKVTSMNIDTLLITG